MDYGKSHAVLERVAALTQQQSLPVAAAQRLLRMLRPATATQRRHVTAVRAKLRHRILNSDHSAGQGPQLLASFDLAAEQLQRRNKDIAGLFFLLLSPLSFSQTQKPAIRIANFLTDEQTLLHSIQELQEKRSQHSSSALLPFEAPAEKLTPADEEPQWIKPSVERTLLCDLLYIIQGVPGKHIKYDCRSEAYVLDPALRLPVTARDVCLSICELGWLYSKVAEGLNIASQRNSELVRQAFTHAVQEELHDYFRLLAVLEYELQQHPTGAMKEMPQLLDVDQMFVSDQAKAQKASGGKDNSGLTLLRLRAWLQEPGERMCVIARLVDCAQDLRGGALISVLHKHCRHGDGMCWQLCQSIMQSVAQPLRLFLTRWILHGELVDPHNEFFIAAAKQMASAKNFWKDTYLLRYEMLPSFFSISLAEKLLNIGKSINFAKLCQQKLSLLRSSDTKDEREVAGDEKTVDKQRTALEALLGDAQSSEESVEHVFRETLEPHFSDAFPLLRFIDGLTERVDAQLMKLLDAQFHIFAHLRACKLFFLLGQGDFITCLMDHVAVELKRKAAQLLRHNLLGILDTALRSSNAQYLPGFIVEKVNIRLLEAAAGDTGWDVFALDYVIDTPLSVVVHYDAIQRYRSIFHMLWRLKRVDWTVASAWKAMTSTTHILHHRLLNTARKKGVLRLVQHCHIHRAYMQHFITNFCNFIMFEVLETAWTHLQQQITHLLSLEQLIVAHDAYLEQIMSKAWLRSPQERLQKCLQQLLQCILRFCQLEEVLIADILTYCGRQQVQESRLRGDFDESVVSVQLMQRFDEVVYDYDQQLALFMTLLKAEGDKADDSLRSLLFRLLFNSDSYAMEQVPRPSFVDISAACI